MNLSNLHCRKWLQVVKEPNFGNETTLRRCCIGADDSTCLTFLWILGMKYVKMAIAVNKFLSFE